MKTLLEKHNINLFGNICELKRLEQAASEAKHQHHEIGLQYLIDNAREKVEFKPQDGYGNTEYKLSSVMSGKATNRVTDMYPVIYDWVGKDYYEIAFIRELLAVKPNRRKCDIDHYMDKYYASIDKIYKGYVFERNIVSCVSYAMDEFTDNEFNIIADAREMLKFVSSYFSSNTSNTCKVTPWARYEDYMWMSFPEFILPMFSVIVPEHGSSFIVMNSIDSLNAKDDVSLALKARVALALLKGFIKATTIINSFVIDFMGKDINPEFIPFWTDGDYVIFNRSVLTCHRRLSSGWSDLSEYVYKKFNELLVYHTYDNLLRLDYAYQIK